jgi:ABC-type antimicrobial peptide transport system ATPase subunit
MRPDFDRVISRVRGQEFHLSFISRPAAPSVSTISHMDRILMFDQGKIVEDGSHDELLLKNGHYARLWNIQAGGFLPDTDELG